MDQRGWTIGDELARIHAELRRDLAAVRAGTRGCLAFCGALRAHHTKEDSAFPRIEAHHPELAAVLDRLRRDHETLARRIQDLADTDLDRLADELEAHFAYEEEQLRAIGADVLRADPEVLP